MPFWLKPRFVCLVTAAILWFLGGSLAVAQPAPVWDGRLLPVEAVEPGMRGTAYTVVQGTKIEPFDVLFLGVLPGSGPAGHLLLVETSGPLIEKTGGIVSGMSGSPVYVDGRLVGAIAYGFSYADHRVGLVTPIGDMFQVLERMAPPEPETPGETASRPVPRHVVLAPDDGTAARLMARLPQGTEVLVPLATPLLAGGFGPRALNLIERWASRLPGGPFLTVPTGSMQAGAGQEPVTFQPGSAFGVQLLGGDVDLSALGTVTWTDGQHFLGFGHPFLNLGNVAFAATGASILRTVTSVEMPFKLGLVTGLAGTLAQDRAAGVGGRLGKLPERVQVVVEVADLDHPRGETPQSFTFWAVNDPWLLPDLITVGVLQALDQGIDRIGPGTARLRFQLEADGLQEPLVRDNMVFSESDVAALALTELLEGVEILSANPFREAPLRKVEVAARITTQPQTAQIVAVRPTSTKVAPGDSLLIEVELQTYRGPREKRAIRLTIPPGTPAGRVPVTVRGGYSTGPSDVVHAEFFAEDGTGDSGEETFPLLPEGGSLEEQLEAFRTRERNYELVAEFYPPFGPLKGAEPEAGSGGAPGAGGAEDPGPDPSDGQSGQRGGLPEDGKPVQARLATDWVIRGSDQFELEIVVPGPSQRPEPAETGDSTAQS